MNLFLGQLLLSEKWMPVDNSDYWFPYPRIKHTVCVEAGIYITSHEIGLHFRNKTGYHNMARFNLEGKEGRLYFNKNILTKELVLQNLLLFPEFEMKEV